MALTGKKYEKFYKTTGSGDDKISTSKLTEAEEIWDYERGKGMEYHIGLPEFAPIIFQLQQMQDELDELRRYVTSNEMLTVSAIGGALPASSKNLASGTLWNNRGLISIV